ncbi:hypothetical protein Ahy_A08g041301 isoform A [Arachis hypogaea]|uniref:Pentatricopeptide repeat-containing protein n=1 Tax=Arachis hypogaea TaxID=3818 RepID=A0A445C2A2_ARAHY|nr:hypothetical protein Ahy_A08g041301 isoform A [Arachis hypogaea]
MWKLKYVVGRLSPNRTFPTSLRLFNHASTQQRHPPQPSSTVISQTNFSRAISLTKQLILSNSHTACSSLFHALTHSQAPNFVSVLIVAFCELGHVQEALSVYRNVSSLPLLKACNALLHALVNTHRFDSLWEVYGDMVSRGFSPTVVSYGILMQCCCSQADSVGARKLFDEMLHRKIEPTVVVYTIMIRVLCNESRMGDAEGVFRLMRESGVAPNLYTYKTLMHGYGKVANVIRVFELYAEMLWHGLHPNVVTFTTMIDILCKVVGDLKTARNCFVYMAKFGVVPNAYAYNSLIDGYCKAGNLSEAMRWKLEMERSKISPDVFTYNILIKGLCDLGRLEEAEGLMQKMKAAGVLANSVTYNVMIDGYCKKGNMEKAIEVCSEMVERKIEPNVITYSTLIDGFCKNRSVNAAMGMYTEMVIKGLVPDVVTYTALIDGHCKHGNMKEAFRLLKEMLDAGLTPNAITFSCLIDGLLKEGRTSDAIKLFLEKTGAGFAGVKMHSSLYSPNNVTYAILVQGLCKDGQIFKATKFFADMRHNGFQPDMLVYVIMLQAHFRYKHMLDVMMLHADMVKTGVVQNASVHRVLSRGYQENGYLRSAHLCSDHLHGSFMTPSKWFTPLVQRSVNKLVYVPMSTSNRKAQFHNILKPPKPNQTLKKYLDGNNPTKVLLHFRYLMRERTTFNSIDSFTFLFALKACNKKHSSIHGKQLHGLITKFGYKDIMDNVEPDQVTVTVALSACADTGALELGNSIHNFIRRNGGLKIDLCLNNALINMYAKCGDITTARRLFDSTKIKDVTTWTSMIVGHALHGQAYEALELFSEMNTGFNIVPNDVTFIGVLMACSHAGLVEEGKQHFRSMTEDYGIRPREAHFGCMVDLLCRGGCLKDAYYFIMEMPVQSNAVIWRTLLGACSLHGELELAAEAREKLLKLDPDYVGDSVALSNIYADKRMWNNKMIARNQIKQSRAPGCSSIEVTSGVGEFVIVNNP